MGRFRGTVGSDPVDIGTSSAVVGESADLLRLKAIVEEQENA